MIDGNGGSRQWGLATRSPCLRSLGRNFVDFCHNKQDRPKLLQVQSPLRIRLP